MIGQGSKDDQPMYRHLGNCAEFKDCVSLFALPDLNRNCTNVNLESHKLNAVINNYKIFDYNSYQFKWGELEYLESYHIKRRKPKLNHGIQASKQFILFD